MKTKLFYTTIALFVVFSLSAQEAKYELKSAVIKKTMEMMGQKFEGTQCFDDYGKNESVTFSMQMQGANTTMRTVIKGTVFTTLNMDNKTGFRATMPEAPINYLNLTPEIRDKYKVKELGEETIIGKPCKKYSAQMSQMGQDVSVTTWVWKGIALKTISSTNNMAMAEEATEIQENAAIDAANFAIPDDFNITDM